jgi:hypothetical protein
MDQLFEFDFKVMPISHRAIKGPGDLTESQYANVAHSNSLMYSGFRWLALGAHQQREIHPPFLVGKPAIASHFARLKTIDAIFVLPFP